MRIMETISEIVERSKQIPDIVDRYHYLWSRWESYFQLGNEVSSSEYHPYCLLISNEINVVRTQMLDQAKKLNPAQFKEIHKTRLLELSKIPDYNPYDPDPETRERERAWLKARDRRSIDSVFIEKIILLIKKEQEKLPPAQTIPGGEIIKAKNLLGWTREDSLFYRIWPQISHLYLIQGDKIKIKKQAYAPALMNTLTRLKCIEKAPPARSLFVHNGNPLENYSRGTRPGTDKCYTETQRFLEKIIERELNRT